MSDVNPRERRPNDQCPPPPSASQQCHCPDCWGCRCPRRKHRLKVNYYKGCFHKQTQTNVFDHRWFILWGMAVFLLCLAGSVQQVCNLGSWAVPVMQGNSNNHSVLCRKSTRPGFSPSNSSYLAEIFRARVPCGLSTFEGWLRPAWTSYPLLPSSLVTRQGAQTFVWE